MSKPTVIFTNFDDAFYSIKNKFLFVEKDDKILELKLSNSSVYSLVYPHSDKTIRENVCKNSEVVSTLLPTVKMLQKLKSNNNFNLFYKDYKERLKSRKEKIIQWIDSLKDDKVYFVCTYEVTTNNVKCYRQLLYHLLSMGSLKDKVNWIYRDGTFLMDLQKIDAGNSEFTDMSRNIINGLNIPENFLMRGTSGSHNNIYLGVNPEISNEFISFQTAAATSGTFNPISRLNARENEIRRSISTRNSNIRESIQAQEDLAIIHSITNNINYRPALVNRIDNSSSILNEITQLLENFDNSRPNNNDDDFNNAIRSNSDDDDFDID